MEENTSPTGEIEKVDAESAMQARKQKMMIIAIGAGVASVAVIAMLVWYFTRSGEAGRPVPAPTMSMSDTPNSSGEQFVDQTITLSATEVENAGLAIEKRGNSSVVYRIALFRNDDAEPCAVGRFVHVYVDAGSRRPVAIPLAIQAALDSLA